MKKILKIRFLLLLGIALCSCATAQEKPKTANVKTTEKIEACEPTGLNDGKNMELKSIAEGANSKIETPFIFVARDAKTYELLKSKVENLPVAAEIDFTKNSVIAAFAGMKNTGGYSLALKQTAENISVELLSPPPDAMTTQALTSPYKISLVPVEEEKSLNLKISDDFKTSMQTYKISSSDFIYSGGLIYSEKKFSVEGTIDVIQTGEFITLDFNFSGAGANSALKFTETASGTLKGGKIELMRLIAGAFPEKVLGNLKDNKLNLFFEPLPTNVSDGFSMNGKLEAVKK